MCANKNLVASLHFAMKIGNRQTRLLGTAIHKMIGWCRGSALVST